MTNQDCFNLILNCTTFKTSLQFKYLFDIDQNICKILILNHEYVVQSNVKENIFEKFIKYWEKREIPDLNYDNIDQFEKLSEEFDLMKDVIQLFRQKHPKQNITTLLDTNSSLQSKLSKRKESLENQTINYRQIIHHLFNNKEIITNIKFLENRKFLYQACHQGNVKFVDLLTKKEVKNENGLSFILNYEEKTAILFQNFSIKSEIFIPRAISYNSIDFIVSSISEGCFSNSKNIKTIEFDENSEINSIDDFSFSKSTLENITIPSSVTKIGRGAFYLCTELQKVQFQPNSKLETIGPLAFSKSSLKSITIPSNVIEICEKAFHDCNKFVSIQFSNDCKLRFIKESAFYRTRITSISIPKSVIQIGMYSFAYCNKLKELIFSNSCSIEKEAFTYSKIHSIKLPSSAYLKEGWCDSLEKLSSVSITKNEEEDERENIRFIDDKFIIGKSDSKSDNFDVLLFACRNIKEAIIPPYIQHIGSHSFGNCEEIEKVEFSNDSKLRTIGISAFQNCSFENIIIPPHVTRIFMNSFAYCDQIKSIQFSPKSELYSIDEYCFSWSKLTSLSIPSSVSEFKEGWCCGTASLVNITVFSNNNNKDYITYFDDKFILSKSDHKSDVFDVLIFARRDIKEAKIPSFIKTIENYAFDGCNELQSVYFEENSQLNTIEQYAFSSTSLEKIDLPPSLTKIDQGCFAYCEKLKEATFPENSELTWIDQAIFSYSTIEKFSIPSNIKNLDKSWCITTTNIKEINIFMNKNEQNILYFENKFILGKSDQLSNNFDVLIFARRDIIEAKIPSFIKRIESYSFDECKKLRKVIFSKDTELNSIGIAAFASSMIEQISIPDHVTKISQYTFTNCRKLRSIFFSNKSELNEIDKDAFILSNLDSFYVPMHVKEISGTLFSGLKNIKIVEFDENSELISINKRNFDRSSVEIIMIPSKMKNIFFTEEKFFVDE